MIFAFFESKSIAITINPFNYNAASWARS